MKGRPDRLAPADRDEHVLLPAIGDLHRDARGVDEPRSLEFGDHAADRSLALRAAGELLDAGRDAAHVADQAPRAVGIGREAADVREDNQPLRAGEDGDVGRELVVVAEARADEFIVGDDIVFVEDGDDALVREQVLDAALDVLVERAAVEVEVGEQHLRHAQTGATESFVVEPHQAWLAQ